MQARRLLRGQWRPALMLFMTMACITVFWLFYFIEGHRLSVISPKTDWVVQWYRCLWIEHSKGLTPDEVQTVCAKGVSHHLPSIPWLAAAELILAIIGVIVTMIFISKTEFWADWAYLLGSLFSRGKLGYGGGRPRGTDDEDDEGNDGSKDPEMERGFSGQGQIHPNHHPHYPHHQYSEPSIRKGARIGYNDALPSEQQHNVPMDIGSPEFKKEYRDINENPDGTQWFDMDDLLDKEYELQEANMQRNLSHGSKTSLHSPSLIHRQLPSAELPYTLGSYSTPHSSEIMYTSSGQG
ncbi:hypothetical protein BGZ65_009228, partial [Modicella reniformis]